MKWLVLFGLDINKHGLMKGMSYLRNNMHDLNGTHYDIKSANITLDVLLRVGLVS